jgi:4-hydroxy-2-oxoglutarate aldolase
MSPKPMPRVPRGIYCPTITFFKADNDQDVDLATQAQHIEFLLNSGVHGIVVHGTTGESVLLSHEERNSVTRVVSKLRDKSQKSTTVVIGCSAQSTREVVNMCRDAHLCGGDFALVLPPSYWVKAATPAALVHFYVEVWEAYIETGNFADLQTGSRQVSDTRHHLFISRGDWWS